MNKKILILGSKEQFSIENMYLRAFKSLGHTTKLFHVYKIRKNLFDKFIWKYLRYFYFIYIRLKILNFIKKNNKFDLIIIFKGLYLKKNFIKNIKKSSYIKFINVFTDNPLDTDYFKDISNENILKSINEFDHCFIYSEQKVNFLKKKYPGILISYLPFAHDFFLHTKTNSKKNINYDISFVGTADNKRFKFIQKLKMFKIILAGDGWNKYRLSKNIKYIKNINAKKFSSVINSSKFSLNLLRDQNKCSHNMKTFEIPSMGGLLVTERSQEQQSFFPENKASLMFNTVRDFKYKIQSLSYKSIKYKNIRKAGYKIAKRNSYKERAKYILEKLYG